jgi:hypothetical protein
MKKNTLSHTLLFLSTSLISSAGVFSTDIIVNGNFEETGGIADPWNYSNHWRNNGAGAVFDANATNNIGSYNSLNQSVNLSANTTLTGDPDYDPNTTLLTGFDTNSISFTAVLPDWAKDRLDPAVADYRMYLEIDIWAPGPDYRFKSNLISADDLFETSGENSGQSITVNGGDEFNTWTWVAGTFAGDLTAAGGINIADIENVLVNLLIYVDTVDPNNTEIAFWIVDDVTLNANFVTVPEPASYTLLAGIFVLASIAMRRRK